MVTDGSYVCGEHSIIYRLRESLCCLPETYVILCVSYTSVFKKWLAAVIYGHSKWEELF